MLRSRMVHAIHDLATQEQSIGAITRTLGLVRNTVRKYLRGSPDAEPRRRRAAKLPGHKTLEAFDFTFQPSLSEPLVRALAVLGFVHTATNFIFLGPPCVGKTHLATALAERADRLETGAQLHSWRTRLRCFLQPQVLLIDEIGYTRLTPAQSHSLFELVNASAMRKEPFCSPATPILLSGAHCSPLLCWIGCSTMRKSSRSMAPAIV